MAKEIGLWIDRTKAVIVSIYRRRVEIKQIESGMGKRIRYSGAPRSKSPYSAQYHQGDDQLDKKYFQQVNKYYSQVLLHLHRAENVLIFGPGEAKRELQKRIVRAKLPVRVVGIETADKMTQRQIAARVRKYFQKAA